MEILFNDLMNRKGRFRASKYLIMTNPTAFMKLLSSVLIVRAEAMFISDEIEYEGYSPYFNPVIEGASIPEYRIEDNDTNLVLA